MDISKQFVADWIEYSISDKPDELDDKFYTVEYLHELGFQQDHNELWAFIIHVYEQDIPDKALAALGAGPLEELLSMAGDLYIGKVEALCRKSSKFKKLLAIVWKSSISDDVWVRVCKVRGEAW